MKPFAAQSSRPTQNPVRKTTGRPSNRQPDSRSNRRPGSPQSPQTTAAKLLNEQKNFLTSLRITAQQIRIGIGVALLIFVLWIVYWYKIFNDQLTFVRAVWNGDQKRVTRMLSQGIDPNLRYSKEIYEPRQAKPSEISPERFPLIDRFARFKAFLEEKFLPSDKHTTPEDFDTPLLLSTSKGDVAMVRLLLSRRIRIDPLAVATAAKSESPELLKVYLDQGTDVNLKAESKTLLMWTCIPGSLACMTLLLDRGADVNQIDANGATALKYAIEGTSSELVHLLLKRGADPTITDWRGENALDYARTLRKTGMTDLLEVTINKTLLARKIEKEKAKAKKQAEKNGKTQTAITDNSKKQ